MRYPHRIEILVLQNRDIELYKSHQLIHQNKTVLQWPRKLYRKAKQLSRDIYYDAKRCCSTLSLYIDDLYSKAYCILRKLTFCDQDGNLLDNVSNNDGAKKDSRFW